MNIQRFGLVALAGMIALLSACAKSTPSAGPSSTPTPTVAASSSSAEPDSSLGFAHGGRRGGGRGAHWHHDGLRQVGDSADECSRFYALLPHHRHADFGLLGSLCRSLAAPPPSLGNAGQFGEPSGDAGSQDQRQRQPGHLQRAPPLPLEERRQRGPSHRRGDQQLPCGDPYHRRHVRAETIPVAGPRCRHSAGMERLASASMPSTTRGAGQEK